MPIFEYSCIKCGHHFENLQKSSATQPPPCPVCGSDDLKKEISLFSSAASGSSASAASCFSGG